MKVRLLPIAEAEADIAAMELENARRGIGFAFTRAYEQALVKIAESPTFYPRAEDAPDGIDTRYIYLARFRYRIVYVVLNDELLVVAVAHTSRAPEYWHMRLDHPPDTI
jgi:hypothetical protein